MPVFVGLLTLELRLPESCSLKDKRMVLQSLLDRLGRRYNLSVAEVGSQDHLQRAEIAVACVANAREHCERQLDAALRLAEAEDRAVVERVELEIL